MTITVTEKHCPTCGETKSVDGFRRDRSNRDGLDAQCKECRRAYREAHREERNARNRAYWNAHREEKRAYDKAYREAHREERRAYDKAYGEAHREERRAYVRAYSRDRHALFGDPTQERWQEITTKHATRAGEPWSEAEEAYLAASTEHVVDDAIALKRAYKSVTKRLTLLRRRGVSLARDRALAA